MCCAGCSAGKAQTDLSNILGAKSEESMETAAAVYLVLQCVHSWINDLVSDSVFPPCKNRHYAHLPSAAVAERTEAEFQVGRCMCVQWVCTEQ